jgi:bifunctional polynucleotide phosphatase/kinase
MKCECIISSKSSKNYGQQCQNNAKDGRFCGIHKTCKSEILVKPVKQQEIESNWHVQGSCGYKIPHDQYTGGHIFCYDYDDTLAARWTTVPLSGVSERLREHLANGDTVVVFTNRKGQKHTTVRNNLDGFEKTLGLPNLPIWIFYALEDDKFRKPSSGMFDLFIELSGAKHNDVVYYCGDAAGRKGDFSDSDMRFAENLQVDFKTPEEVFTVIPANVEFPDISKMISDAGPKVTIIMVGPQGSGKSTFAKQINETTHALIINGDTQGKQQHAIFQRNLDKSLIIVDNTNRDVQTRSQWITPERETIIIYFDVPKPKTFINIAAREALTGVHIPTIAIHVYYKGLIPPTSAEGTILVLKN